MWVITDCVGRYLECGSLLTCTVGRYLECGSLGVVRRLGMGWGVEGEGCSRGGSLYGVYVESLYQNMGHRSERELVPGVNVAKAGRYTQQRPVAIPGLSLT